jgi:WD40 repeat protein
MLLKSLYGDDVFISYSRRDGALYAAGIADKLTEQKLSCFIDKLGVEPNHNLPPSLIKKIQSCKVFVLIGTEGASASNFVAQEIEVFKKTGRTILPIDFNGAVGRARWYELIPGLATEMERNPASLETGTPSPNVISFIEKSFRYTRRNQRMLRMFWGALTVFLTLVALSVVFLFIARNQVAKAGVAEQLARQRDMEAQASQQKADAAALLAQQMQEKADKATRDADTATRTAEEKTRLAQEAERKANEALGRQRVAEARAIKQEQIATSRERASASLSLLPIDPEASLELAQDAIHQADTTQAEEALRGALFESHVQAVLPGAFNSFGEKAFDPTGRLALLGGNNGKVQVVEARTGKMVAELTAPTVATSETSSNQTANGSAPEVILTGTTFSPNGEYVAAADGSLSRQATVYLWRWESMDKQPRVLRGTVPDNVSAARCSFSCRILTIAFSPDGKYLAGAGEDGVVWVWETATGERKRLMTNHTSAINQVSFSPQGRYIVSAGADGQAILWDWNADQNAMNPRSLPHEERPVGSSIFSPGEGEYIVTTSERHVQGQTFSRVEAGEAWVWKTSTGEKVASLTGHTGVITSVEFSPDGKYILTASSDSTARVWDWKSEQMNSHPAILSGHTDGLRGARFSPDGQYVLTFSQDNTARLWKPETGRFIAESSQISTNVPFLSVLRGHTADINSATFSPDGELILTVASDQTARVWRAEGEQVIASLPKQRLALQSATFSPDASLVATTTVGFQPVRVWNWQAQNNSQPLAELRTPTMRKFSHAAFSPDDQLIAASVDNNAGAANAPESEIAVWEWTEDKRRSDPLILGGCRNIINSVAFSHDPKGRYIIAAGGAAKSARTGEPVRPNSGIVCIWDREAKEGRTNPIILHRQEGGKAQDNGTLWRASFSKDNKYVVAAASGSRATGGGVVLVWDWQSSDAWHKPLVLKSITGGSFSDAVFSPDGNYIAAAGGGPFIAMVWEWKSDKGRNNPKVLRGHVDFLTSVAFSPDGKLILTSSKDGTERLWSLNTGRSLAIISGHAAWSAGASFSPDGKLILTTEDKTARIYACEKCAPVSDLKSLARIYILPNSLRQ